MLPARIWIETLIFSVHPAQICMVNGFYIYFEDFYFFATISAPTVSIFSLFIWLLRCWSQIGKKGTIRLPAHIWIEKKYLFIHPPQICIVKWFYIDLYDVYFFSTISAPTVSIFSLYIWFLRSGSQIGQKGTMMLPAHIWIETSIFFCPPTSNMYGQWILHWFWGLYFFPHHFSTYGYLIIIICLIS